MAWRPRWRGSGVRVSVSSVVGRAGGEGGAVARAREAMAEAVAATASVVVGGRRGVEGAAMQHRGDGGNDRRVVTRNTAPGTATAQLDRPKHEASLHLARAVASARGQVVRAGPIARITALPAAESIPPVQNPLLTRVSARGRPESSITASAALVAPMRRRLETARLVASGVARVVAGALTDRNSALRAHRACERRSSHGRPPRDPSENGPRPKTKRWLSR